MNRHYLKIAFSILIYLFAWATILYYLDFFTGYLVPKSIDDGLNWHWTAALMWDLFLLCGVGMLYQQAQKEFFLEQLPNGLGRSVQIALYAGGLLALISLWRPINLVVYDVRDDALAILLNGIYYWGWWMSLTASFLLDHLTQFGVKQSWGGKEDQQTDLATPFKTPLLYLLVRHPLYLGIIIFHFATPYLTLGRLLLAVVVSMYLYRQTEREEARKLAMFGDRYLAYQKRVPKLFPWQTASMRAQANQNPQLDLSRISDFSTEDW